MPIKSRQWYEYFETQPSGVSLTSTLSHGTDSSAYTKIYPQGKIRTSVTCATVGKAVTVTMETPAAFKVIDATFWASAAVGATPGMVVDIKNNTTSVIAQMTTGTAHNISRAASLDDGQVNFALGDDDLVVIVSCSSTGTAIVVLDVLFT